MSQIVNSFYDMRILDDMARRRSYIHDLHPVVKVMVTVFYLVAVVSFPRHEIIGLLPFFIYPVAVFTLGDLAFMPILKRLLFVEPFIIGIGLLSPFFEPLGWFTFASIVIKSSLTVTAALLLIATTGMDKLGLALRLFRIPKIFVLQLMLTYRYISVLLEEFSKTILAYSLRAPGQKGIHFSSWGSLIGQMLLRTFDRAQRIYHAMSIRGFDGEYNIGNVKSAALQDLIYLVLWTGFFVFAALNNIPMLIGNLITGVI